MGWGGSREGSGRPSTGRKKVNFYITPEEEKKLRLELDRMRSDSGEIQAETDTELQEAIEQFKIDQDKVNLNLALMRSCGMAKKEITAEAMKLLGI